MALRETHGTSHISVIDGNEMMVSVSTSELPLASLKVRNDC